LRPFALTRDSPGSWAADPRKNQHPDARSIDVTYRRHETLEMWVPSKMTELYEGAIPRGESPSVFGRATTQATYSEFRHFGTSVRINIPK
jgi:hypothetical protein